VTLLRVASEVVAVVAVLLAVGLYAFAPHRDARAALATARANARRVGPTAAVLAVVLLANGVIRDAGVQLSWLVGVNVTGGIYAVEGEFVATVQSFATPELTAFLSFVYVFGYAFLVTFPLALYALYDDTTPLRTTLVAYSLNYGLGLVCYVVFIAYGPRNFMPELVSSLLYTTWPQSQLLTSQVNANTNVFPSLHASLSATVALVAYRFQGRHPRWVPLATVAAVAVALSTMYLGIHWLTDVGGGVVLAVLSVALASRLVARTSERNRPSRVRGLGRAVLRRLQQ